MGDIVIQDAEGKIIKLTEWVKFVEPIPEADFLNGPMRILSHNKFDDTLNVMSLVPMTIYTVPREKVLKTEKPE